MTLPEPCETIESIDDLELVECRDGWWVEDTAYRVKSGPFKKRAGALAAKARIVARRIAAITRGSVA